MNNIISLTIFEKEAFFPGESYAQLQTMMTPFIEINPDDLNDTQQWHTLLEKNQPEILLAAWATPPLAQDCQQRVPSLKYVCYAAGSIRKLIPRIAIANGLQVTNWGDSISRTVAENALLLMLCCMRHVAYWQQQLHNNSGWKDRSVTVTQSLFERRIGLHGFGAISQKLALLLQPFTSEIYAYSPHVPDAIFEKLGVKRTDSLETLFSESDVIVELASLTEHNNKIITEQLLRRMPDGAAFVNVGRGLVVDEDALARVAHEKQIQVGLDVYAIEPLPGDSPLRSMNNVTLLPHLGGPTTDRRKDAGEQALKYLQEFKLTSKIKDAISLNRYDRST